MMSLKCIIASWALCSVAALAAAPVKPNFVFFLIDDLGRQEVGCYGSTFHETPRVDQLAKEGIRFTDAYAASPVCSPTCASILTSKYAGRIGITPNL